MELNRIKGARVEAGLTQKEMAGKLGMSHLTYHQKEVGKSDFKVDEMRKFCDIVNKPVENFF